MCPRCQGFIEHVTLNGDREECGQVTPAIRCVNCGFFADRLMYDRWLSYRQQAAVPVPTVAWGPNVLKG